MQVRVQLFAAAREAVGSGHLTCELPPGATVAQLKAALAQASSALAALLPKLRVAVDEVFADDQQVLTAASDVALIPPVSGGKALFRVQPEPLSLDAVVEAVSAPSQGGVVTFTGVVRSSSRGLSVQRLEYEAYVPMAEKVLASIGAEVEAKWPGTLTAVVHRVGTLVPGELAVVIAVSAPHRAAAFEACAFLLERLKADVPIWKKETTQDGAVWVGLGP